MHGRVLRAESSWQGTLPAGVLSASTLRINFDPNRSLAMNARSKHAVVPTPLKSRTSTALVKNTPGFIAWGTFSNDAQHKVRHKHKNHQQQKAPLPAGGKYSTAACPDVSHVSSTGMMGLRWKMESASVGSRSQNGVFWVSPECKIRTGCPPA